jgi:hypothetical protein
MCIIFWHTAKKMSPMKILIQGLCNTHLEVLFEEKDDDIHFVFDDVNGGNANQLHMAFCLITL